MSVQPAKAHVLVESITVKSTTAISARAARMAKKTILTMASGAFKITGDKTDDQARPIQEGPRPTGAPPPNSFKVAEIAAIRAARPSPAERCRERRLT
jgi:hypothetical protein